LLDGLEKIEWSEAIKDMQRNWIGRSEGAEVLFPIKDAYSTGQNICLEVFTTRPDTIFGVSFMAIAPEHPLVPLLTRDSQAQAVESYLAECKKKTERERQADIKNISGVFTGSFVIHPFTKKEIWIGTIR
jgi:leucyl-tRNA synthetase